MSKEQDATALLGASKAVRIPWATLDEPRKFKGKDGKESGEPKYSGTFLIPADHPDLKEHKQLIAKLLKDKYGDKVSFSEGKIYIDDLDEDGETIKVKLKLPFSSGDVEAMKAMEKGKDRSFCAGMVLLKTSSLYPIPVFDARQRDEKGEPMLVGLGSEPSDDDSTDTKAERGRIKKVLYGGCFVAAEVKYRTYPKHGTNPPGVTAYLQKVCFVKDGDRIASGVSGDVFTSVQGAVTKDDPTGGEGLEDDDISF